MIKQIRTYFHSNKLPRWFKILNLSLILPILLWPFIFYTTIFFFDNPSNLVTTLFIFLLVNAYPLYLIILVLLNAKLYAWNRWLGILLPIAFLLSMISGAVYIGLKMSENLKKADQEAVERKERGELGSGYIKRSSLIYLNDTLVPGADADSFETISWDWARDKHFYYYLGKPVPAIDYATFELLDYHYAKDKNNVFYDNEVILGADSKTFQHIEGSQDGKDKNGCYRYGEKVDCKVLLEEE